MTPRAGEASFSTTTAYSSSSSSSSVQSPPDFVAVILAASSGARLFPLTTTNVDGGGGGAAGVPSFDDDDGDSSDQCLERQKTAGGGSNDEEDSAGGGGGGGLPKHLLPVGGTPVLTRLVRTVRRCGRFRSCVVAVAHGDRSTLRELRRHYREVVGGKAATSAAAAVRLVSEEDGSFVVAVATLPPDCAGSADAIRHLLSVEFDDDDSSSPPSSAAAATRFAIIPGGSGVVVMPGDLVLEGGGLLGLLADAHRGSGPGSGGGMGFGASLGGGGGGRRGGGRGARQAVASSCTVLLSDVGEEDESGVPLRESAKHKKGGLARDEEDMEYIGLSSALATSGAAAGAAELQRIVLKRSKIDVEEDAETGDTPKLSFPKSRLVGGGGGGRNGGGGTVCIRTDLSDLHVYVLSPWVLRLIQVRTKLTSIQGDVLPLLVTRQFGGVRAAFGGGEAAAAGRKRSESYSLRQGGSSMQMQVQMQGGGQDQATPTEEVPSEVLASLWEDAAKPWPWSTSVGGLLDEGNNDDVDATTRAVDSPAYETRSSSSSSSSGGAAGGVGVGGGHRSPPSPEMPFVVTCTVLPRGARLAVRACTVPSYLYACRELVAHAIRFPPPEELIVRDASAGFTPSGGRGEASVLSALASSFDGLGGRILHKFNSVVLPDCDVGDKVTIKSSTVGRRCTLGNRCRLNNVVLMDGAVIGENCVLQNSVIGPGATIGENCSLNDVQVGPGADVTSGTKLKGESVTVDMVMLDAADGGTGFS